MPTCRRSCVTRVQGSSLDPGKQMTCEATYTTTQADVNRGSIVNTGTVTGTPPSGGPVTDSDTATVTANQGPDVTIEKSASPTTFAEAGTPISYTYVVTNNGNVTLTGVRVTDPHVGLSPLVCDPTQPATLEPGDTMTCTATYTTTQADVNRGHIENTGTVTGTTPSGDTVTDSDTATVTANQGPDVTIEKSASPTTFAEAGTPISYTYVVTNNGNVTLTGVRVTDPHVGLSPLVCDPTQPATLEPGDTMTCTATYTTTQADVNRGHIENTGTVTGTTPSGDTVTDSDTATVTANQGPDVTIEKSASPTTFAEAGTPISYTYVVTNNGNVTLTGVRVTDPHVGLSPLVCDPTQPATLEPGDTMTCTATYTTTQADVNRGHIENTGTVTGTTPSGDTVTDSDTATVTASQAPAITIEKSASPTTFAEAGTPISYTYVVTNNGNVTLTGVRVTDPHVGLSPLVCDPTQPATLEPGDTMTCTATYTTTQADVNRGHIENTGTVTGTTPSGDTVTDSDTATVTASQAPAITVQKSASPTTFAEAGTPISYTYVVTNNGNVTLTGVRVTDPHVGLSPLVCDPTQPATLEPGDTMTCTATYTTTQADVNRGHIENTGTVTGTTPSGDTVTDSDTATVTANQGPDVTIEKSASPTTFAEAGTPISYTYVVTNNGNVTLTGVRVTDPHVGLSPLVCDPTQPATLEPGDTMTCTATYTTTQADVNRGHIENTGTVTGTTPSGDTVTDSDTATVTASQAPAITIEKSASPTTFAEAGTPISYTYVVTNNGNVTLTGVRVTDPHVGLSPLVCDPTQPATLEPGDTMTCTATYTTTQADVNRGHIENTGTVTGTTPSGDTVTDSDTATVTASQAPAITVQKSASPTTFAEAGTPISYTYVVTNNGNVTLTGVRVTDPHVGLSPLVCDPTQPATLEPGDTMTCTATYTTTQADVNRGHIENTGTVTGTTPSGDTVTDSDTATVTANQGPDVTIEKSASPTTFAEAGTPISYTYVVTNNGNVTLTGVRVTDPHVGLSPLVCDPTQPATLEPGDTMTCTATYTTTQADVNRGHIENTGTVTGTTPSGDTVTDSDTATVTASQAPAITIEKSASPTTFAEAGTPISYTYVVTNNGNVTLTGVRVTDPHVGLSPLVCDPTQPATLEPGDTMTCTATYTTTQADVNRGHIENTGTVTGTTPSGDTVTDSDTATVTASQAPAITVQKSASPTTFAEAGTPISYTYVVTNNGNVTLTGVRVTDPHVGLSPLVCDPTQPATLEPGDTMTCTATYTTTQADVNRGHIENTGTVTGTTPSGDTVTDSDTATVTASQAPAITIEKSASPTTFAEAGTPISYTYVVTNNGNVTLTGVRVTDPHVGLSPLVCDPTQPATLEPGDTMTCTATYTTTQADVNRGHIENTGTVTGTTPSGDTVTDSDTATVTASQAPAITVQKSASPTTFAEAGTPISYTYVVTNNGNVTLTGVRVTDPHVGLSPLVCDPTQPATLEPGDTMTCEATYTTTQADVNRGSIENTGTATGTTPSGDTVTDSDTATVTASQAPAITVEKSASPTTFAAAGTPISYTYVVTNNGNVTLTNVRVTDPHADLSPIVCDPVQGSSLDPGKQMTCEATYTTTQADVNRGSIVNTGTVTGTPPSGGPVTDSDTATVTANRGPDVTVEKSASPTTFAAAGTPISYTYVVTNNGNVTLTNVRVTDPHADLSPIVCDPVQGSSLDPGKQMTCEATYTTTQADVNRGSIVNTGTVTGTPPSGGPVTDSDTATVTANQGPDVTVEKSASPTTFAAAGTPISYTYVVTNNGNVTLTNVRVTDPHADLSPIVCDPVQGSSLD